MTINKAYKILEWTVPARHGLYGEDEFDQYCEDCENLTKAQETLRNYLEKYKWHDIRKNPKDVPSHYNDILVVTDIGQYDRGWYSPGSHFICCGAYTKGAVIAWKEIGLFEEEE